MRKILLFGAGKSATVLIDYLKTISIEKNWKVIVADGNYENAKAKTGIHQNVEPIEINIENAEQRKQLIQSADIVISLMPPTLHLLIAEDCIEFSKNLLTASYIDEPTKALADKAKEKGILFLYEMGLDPGIDHLSAMQIIDDIHQKGGKIVTFKSHCGGLVAPESDDNPWHYKISWNPKNVVMAGKAGATFLHNGNIVQLPYNELFDALNIVKFPNEELFAYYPNRDSLSYIDLYGLHNVKTFVRTTLRHPEFNSGWKNIIDLNLTSEDKIYETNGMSISKFLKLHFEKNNFTQWVEEMMMAKLDRKKDTLDEFVKIVEAEQAAIEKGEEPQATIMTVNEAGKLNTIDVETIKDTTAEWVIEQMDEAKKSINQLYFLGMEDETTLINLGLCSAADVLQFILEKKLVLQPEDKDMIVMLHEFEYMLEDKKYSIKSMLRVIGEDSLHTAMAKTVGLPLGIAATFILEGKIKETGLHIPTLPSIYEPVLNELTKYNIIFEEKCELVE